MDNKEKEQRSCPLCGTEGEKFYRDKFFKCPECQGIFMAKDRLPTPEEEKKRYETHNNDITDPRYRNFVSPITSSILEHHSPADKGLDFGAGTGPVISAVLQENGYNIAPYDPFFENKPELLTGAYDYIVCCEVAEHFHDPAKEFLRLKKLLKKGGYLYIMTELYREDIDFENWHYKDDPTHVFIYSRETFELIKRKFGFSSLFIKGRLIVLTD
jgi:SAM-dependent methyltransferase